MSCANYQPLSTVYFLEHSVLIYSDKIALIDHYSVHSSKSFKLIFIQFGEESLNRLHYRQHPQ